MSLRRTCLLLFWLPFAASGIDVSSAQYLINSVGVEITVADNAKRSEGLPFWFIHPGERTNLDGLNITLRGWLEDDLSGIPIHGAAGALYPIEYEKLNQRGVNGSGFGNREELTNPAFASLRPGLQTYHYRYHIELFDGPAPLDTTNAPVAARVIDKTLRWRLVSEDAAPPLPTLQTNLALRDAIQESIRCQFVLRDTRDTTLVECSVQADDPPGDSAFDVLIKSGDRTFPLGPVAWMKGKIEGWPFQTDLPEDIQSVDLVLVPSAKAGARLKADLPFRITRLEQIWSGAPIVLTNIPVRKQEIAMIRIAPPTLQAARNYALNELDDSDPIIQQLIENGDWSAAQNALQGKSDPRSRYNLACIELAKGDLSKSFQIFVSLREAQRVQRQLRRICSLYLDRAESGDLLCMLALGAAYEHGWGVKQDFQEAKRWYRDAANAGNVGAMGPLAKLYEDEAGATVRTADAHEWYRQQTLLWYQRAAAGGDSTASQWLANHNSN